MRKLYFVYIIQCTGGGLYTGVAADWQKRLGEHAKGSPAAARYTRAHPPLSLEALWQAEDKVSAMQLEYRIKRLSRTQKQQLIRQPELLGQLLPMLTGVYTPVADAHFSF